MDDLLNDFLLDTAEALPLVEAELVALEADPTQRAALDAVFRAVHSLKGACGFMKLRRLEALAHAAEDLLVRFRDAPQAITPAAMGLAFHATDAIREIVTHLELVGAEPPGEDAELIAALKTVAAAGERPKSAAKPPPADIQFSISATTKQGREPVRQTLSADTLRPRPTPPERRQSARPPPPETPTPEIAPRTVRVDVEVLDELSAGVDELVRTRNQLLGLLPSVDDPALRAPLQRLSVITGELQDGMARARLEPIGAVWRSLPRVVRDLSVRLGKDIDLRLDGGSVEVDRELVEALKDPLSHLVRNAADHGLEPPAERLSAGKPLRGLLKLAAWTEDESLLIRVSDDGRGLDADAIRYAAVSDGWLSPGEAAVLTDAQVHRLVFVPGLTTLSTATPLSGRGVGLDAVRAAVQRLGGRISIGSTPGHGTTFTLRMPLGQEVSAPDSAAEPPVAVEAQPSVEPQEPAAVVEPPAPVAPAPRRVLLIEGSAFLRHMMTPLLTAAGYEVTAAGSTDEAWRLHAAGTEFDAIVSDLDSSGETFTRRLDDSRWSAAPRIALTDLPPAETPAPGFAEVVRKSDRQGLISVLSGALGSDGSAERAA